MQFDREAFEKRMVELRRVYVDHLPERRDVIRALKTAVAKNPAAPEAREKISELREIAHKLAGSGGSFGAPQVGEVAATVESACEAILEGANPPSDGAWTDVEKLLDGLTAAIDDVVQRTAAG